MAAKNKMPSNTLEKSSSLEDFEKLKYSKAVLVKYGSVTDLTAGCAGSGADSGTYSEDSFIGPDGSCNTT